MSVEFQQATGHDITEESTLDNYHCGNLKSCGVQFFQHRAFLNDVECLIISEINSCKYEIISCHIGHISQVFYGMPSHNTVSCS
jgi:hypothetical protein